jgi:hypothetical protein
MLQQNKILKVCFLTVFCFLVVWPFCDGGCGAHMLL